MSRAKGKHDVRPAKIEPGTAEGRDIGLSDRQLGTPSPIPGAELHITNRQTMRQSIPVPPARPEYRGTNAHGVQPGTYTTHERGTSLQGPNAQHAAKPEFEKPTEEPPPIPVRVVNTGLAKVLRSASPYHLTMPASTAEPVRLCGRDGRRTAVWLLNEDTASNIRFAQRPSDLTNGGGALLPWPTNSYLKLDVQDELYGISADSGTPRVSVIQVFDQES